MSPLKPLYCSPFNAFVKPDGYYTVAASLGYLSVGLCASHVFLPSINQAHMHHISSCKIYQKHDQDVLIMLVLSITNAVK